MKLQKIYAEVVEEEALKQFNSALALECVVAGALMPVVDHIKPLVNIKG